MKNERSNQTNRELKTVQTSTSRTYAPRFRPILLCRNVQIYSLQHKVTN